MVSDCHVIGRRTRPSGPRPTVADEGPPPSAVAPFTRERPLPRLMPFGRRNPFREIEDLLERMGRELDAEQWPVDAGIDIDVADHDDRYVVTADLPGYDKADIDVRLVAGSLHIEADRELETGEERPDYLRRERRRESVSRRVSLPDPVDEDGITATHNNGVLTVELPKQATDAGTSIDID